MLSVDDKLTVFRQLISCAAPIPFTQYDPQTLDVLTEGAASDSVLYFLFCMDNSQQESDPTDKLSFEAFRKADGYRPIVCTNSLGMIWISEIEELAQKPYRIHTLGPVFANDYSSQAITQSLSGHLLSDDVRREVMDFIHSIPVVSIIRFYEYGLMLHWCLTETHISLSDLMYIDARSKSDTEMRDARQNHGTYLAEQRLLRAVRDGNLQFYRQMNNFASVGYTEQFIVRNNLRYLKNYVIIYTALCCRAAVEGGLDVETAYTLSDQYLENIENTNSLSTLHELSEAMVKDYIERVRRAKTSGRLSPQIQKACDWIALEPQLHTLHSLAEKLGYTDYYFSRLFKKETGKSVSEYILLQKIEAAKQLLISTGLSVAEITDRLGLESQSYFTARFRKATGITPKAYRSAHQSPGTRK